MAKHVTISSDPERKPETMTYYNSTKVGVDVLDQKAWQYSVKAINAWVLHRCCMKNEVPRRDFILQLAEELRAEWMALRASPRVVVPDLPVDTGAEAQRRMTCAVKAFCKQNKTFCKCIKSGSAVCGKCTARVLNVCKKCV